MALSPLKKEKLAQLELNKGGVAFVSQKSSVTPNPTVIISLGGLGGKTLNALKGKFVREIGESDHIYFRMIDTSLPDMDDLCKVKSDGTMNTSPNAHLEQIEALPLFDPAIANILKAGSIPPNIKNWLNPALIGTELDNSGAQQIRQIGRAMLTNDTVYFNVRTKLSSAILSAIGQMPFGGNVDVILIAGVSGGTGSGTVIDLSYMIHDIFKSAGSTSYKLAGYIFTPDAQFMIPQIKNNPTTLLNLKKNGYAALKEIDYFMNIQETESVYKLVLGSSEVTSTKNIFSSCTLVSGYASGGGMNDTDVTIGRLTDQLMDMLTDITITDKGGMPQQMSASILSNENANLNSWFGLHPARRIYHRYASYKYQVLGYNSIVIPRDEILAYCVNKIYAGVLQEFQNFSLVNKQMMQKVFAQTNVINPDTFVQFATTINANNPIDRTLVMDGGYTKSMIKSDPMIAYNDAVDLAHAERVKINAGFQSMVEDHLYKALSQEVDKIFNQFGPYVAMKAIEHKHTELSVGDPKEPFPGIIEMLERQSEKLMARANAANNAFNNGGHQQIQAAANEAMGGLFGTNHAAVNSYVEICCNQAVTSQIDVVLFKTLSDALYNVAVRMNKLNSDLFEVYTSILTEIQKILNQDGQYFSDSNMSQVGKNRYFSIDIIKSGKGKAERLEKYLDSFISTVSVQELAQNFIKKMRENRDKWVAQNSENDFDVVAEVRDLMDACLNSNKMTTDIVEKFVTVAYSTKDMKPEELDAIWDDNTPTGPKMQALASAANEIYQQLSNGAQPMANSTGQIPLNSFAGQLFISTLKDTPQLTNILNNLVKGAQGFTPATSDSKNKFIFTRQYMSLPMYILLGMGEYNQVYVDNPSAGRHMDENNQNWGRFPNPYTIDSVAIDLASAQRPAQDIALYPDYKVLTDVRAKAIDGVKKYGFIDVQVDATGMGHMYLNDITNKPADMEAFKAGLYAALTKKKNLNVIEYMKQNGFIINPIEVRRGQTDVDLALLDFANAAPTDLSGMYKDIPVNIPDVYKWLRKSIKYMDILDKDTAIFEELQAVIEQAERDGRAKSKFIDDVETFAFALRTGMVKQNEKNPKIWNYMDGKEPVAVNFGRAKAFDRKYFLYHVFVSFQQLDEKRLQAYNAQAGKKIDEGAEIDYEFLSDHITEMLSDSELGDVFNAEVVNEEAEEQGVTENYQVTDRVDDKGNPYKVLKRFYELIQTSFE